MIAPSEGQPSTYLVPNDADRQVKTLARSLSRIDWIVTVLPSGVEVPVSSQA